MTGIIVAAVKIDTMYSDIPEEDEEYCEVDVEEEVKHLARRRFITVLSIVAVFLICGSILAISVVYDVRARAGANLDWSEFSCPEDDATCQALLCPDGMGWQEEGVWEGVRSFPGTPAAPPAPTSTPVTRWGREGWGGVAMQRGWCPQHTSRSAGRDTSGYSGRGGA